MHLGEEDRVTVVKGLSMNFDPLTFDPLDLPSVDVFVYIMGLFSSFGHGVHIGRLYPGLSIHPPSLL